MVIPFSEPSSAPTWLEPSGRERQRPAVRAPHLRIVPPVRELPAVLARRRPALVRQLFPWLARVTDSYFRSEVEGAEHLSARASVVVSTHNGAWVMPDLLTLFVAFLRRFGLETPAYGMMHRLGFQIPWFGPTLASLGAIEASRDNARTVLREGFPLLVCPGGDTDALKPFAQRHEIAFSGHRGFVRLALSEQVPLVPVVSVGAHEIFFVLNDGRRLAELSGAAQHLRLKSIPLTLAFPVGLTLGGVGAIPLPSKIRVRILPPIELAEPRSRATDPAVVERCYRHVRATMQRGLDELARQRRWPVLG